MNVSFLARYNNYSYPARGLARANPAQRNQAAAARDNARALPGISDNEAAARGGLFVNRYPSKLIKRVGYTELDGSWDQFAVSRFVDLIERNTGGALDAGAVMRRYDADGDGLLNMDEQTAMIKGLTKAEFEGVEVSREVAESVIEQLRELSERDETRNVSGMIMAVRQYERMFFYKNSETPEEIMVTAV
ncbi:MAG: hypothetical protein LBB94_03265 [Clostridiales bacterium]|jgi:hypothetical protein|nr:hypothetical protein [Clostridiales bacterium]